MSSDFKGDPASALLEVLDPEQNYMFNDHYMDLDYDLSDVMFITTANMLSNIPLPLRDRMEIIELSSYTEYEKLSIATTYLVKRQKEACGIADIDIQITEDALRTIINHYTRESGVRQLEREIASVCRKIAKKVVLQKIEEPVFIDAGDISDYLGIHKFSVNKKESSNRIGLVNGLAVTSVGGDLLPVEASVVPGKGKLILTGHIGDVMQESARAALTYVRSRAGMLGLKDDFHKTLDIHVHFPEGAVPKDGPSAGITSVVCLVSALTQTPVYSNLAMTGEITLRGRVLPIGGLKEKILAAHRSHVTRVIIPFENKKDIHDIPGRVLENMEIVLVEHMDQVIRLALADESIEKQFKNTPAAPVYRNGKLAE
jgi:ATP-dependent Lon protease